MDFNTKMMTDGHVGGGNVFVSPPAGLLNLQDMKVIQEDGQTYVIVMKDNKKGITAINQRQQHHTATRVKCKLENHCMSGKDSVKRSLANLGEEDRDEYYARPTELLKLFDTDKTSTLQEKDINSLTAAKRLCRSHLKTKSRLGSTSSAVSNLNQMISSKLTDTSTTTNSSAPNGVLSRKLFTSPVPGCTNPHEFTKLKDTTKVNMLKLTPTFVKSAYQTPTSELPIDKSSGAVRKIFITQETTSSGSHSSSSANSQQQNSTVILTYSPAHTHLSGKASLQNPILSPIFVTPNRSSENSPLIPSEDKSKSLNESLTNIQWLGALATDGLVPKSKAKCSVPSKNEIEKVSLECGRHKRPAYSYMMLIRMALNTRPDKRLTLREICKWIEDTFPFYKHTAKPGWKNSIRHNLSVYDIFVRVPTNPKQHGSQWTVREVNTKKTKYGKKGANSVNNVMNPPVPVVDNTGYGTNPSYPLNPLDKKKKGPKPILPRPNPHTLMPPGRNMHAYALIPIASLSGAITQTSSLTMTPRTSSPQITCANIQVNQNYEPVDVKPIIQLSDNRLGECLSSTNLPMRQLKREVEENPVKPGLPKPKMYPKPLTEKSNNLLSPLPLDNDLDNGLPTPLRELLEPSNCESLSTSTPSKPTLNSPHWLSPISATPTQPVGLGDGSFLDFLPSQLDLHSPSIMTPVKSLEAWMKIASNLLDTPNAPGTDLTSPCQSSKAAHRDVENIGHLLAEIDPGLAEDLENCPLNLSSLNWPLLDGNT